MVSSYSPKLKKKFEFKNILGTPREILYKNRKKRILGNIKLLQKRKTCKVWLT